MISVQNNMQAWCANRQFQLNKKDNAKNAEKLSSGYRINRAADDAAGLAISEKMRKRIRGLAQGTKNGQDGVSWVQTGDGALNEAHDIMHRMTELTVKSLNGTNSDSDRAAMDAEFQWLKLELDRISSTTKFNEINIFEEHDPTYYQCDGGAIWDSDQMHVVTEGQNEITFEYRAKEDGPSKTVTFTVPPGKYTTIELLDELEEVLPKDNGDGSRFVLDYNEGGFVNVSLENGEVIDSITGGLSYLIYDMYKGGSTGALIGTTIFPRETSKLNIVTGKNDDMTFTIEYFDGTSDEVRITVPGGTDDKAKGYTRQELMDEINKQLKNQLGEDTSVQATGYGTGIKLSSSEGIVTGFKGNMFRIDGAKYNSVFYDNVKWGEVKQTAAKLVGGYVLNTDSRDEKHNKLKIDGTNNTLTFQPNEADTPVDFVLEDGEYDIETIRNKLNDFFADHGFDLNAEMIESTVYVGDKYVNFQALKIDSGLKGPDSTVGLDENSSAYKTIFVTRNYDYYSRPIQPSNENDPDNEGYFKGSKDLSGVSASSPITLAGTSFKIQIKQTGSAASAAQTITLSKTKFTSAEEIATDINKKIGNNSVLKGKVTADVENGKIIIKGVEGKNVDKVSVTANGTNKGFDSVFQGYYHYVTPSTASGNGSVTLNSGPVSSSSMTIYVDGVPHTVDFGKTNPNNTEIANAINNQIKASKYTTPNTFTNASARGSSSDRNFTSSGNGGETFTAYRDSAQGNTVREEGRVEPIKNEAAKLTLKPQLRDSMDVKAALGNNKLSLTINGVTRTVTLKDGGYNQKTLAEELQRQIDSEFGTGMGGAKVTYSGNQLTLTARLPDGENGEDTSIAYDTGTSSFLKFLDTKETPAVCTSNVALSPSIKIDGTSNVFSFSYTENGTTKDINLTLDNNTYTTATFITQIQKQLNKTGTGITASLSQGRLVLTSKATGNDVSISFNSRNGGSATEAIFGKLTGDSPASIVLNRDIQSSITIESGKQDFTINVNGTPQTVTLDAKTYKSRDEFVQQLKTKLSAVGVEAYLSGNRLGFRTTQTGTGATISMSYGSGGSSMEAIFGSTTTQVPGVKASWTNGNLKLTAVDTAGKTMSNVSIMVASNSGGGLQKPNEENIALSNTSYEGYHSRKYSNVDGVDLNGNVTIDQWNNDLRFKFYDNGTSKTFDYTVPDGTYDYATLAKSLQDAVDQQIGAGKITVTVDKNGVKLQSAQYGSNYKFDALEGDFYLKVMNLFSEKSVDQKVTNTDGTQEVTRAYTVGRRDVKSAPVEISTGVNDQLSLDLTYGGDTHTISVTLDAGKYNSAALKKHLQGKIDEALVKENLKAGLIRVGVGDISTGVAGGNDDRALNFSLSETVASPATGDFIIDGVSGSAAFEIFYQTDGKMTPAYIMGNKDITEGVTINKDEGDLTFDVDGTEYTIHLEEERDYTAEELVDAINEQFTAGGVPLAANINYDDGRLKISHKMIDEHEIRKVSGGAKNDVFFSESGAVDDGMVRLIQLSDMKTDNLELPRSQFSTATLGIHSVCITRPKYATKALGRLKTALEKVSNLRSTFGSTQNRLEHAINNNNNAEENMQDAESSIRDTDMAKQMVAYSNQKILEQVGQAMMAQANRSNEIILALLD